MGVVVLPSPKDFSMSSNISQHYVPQFYLEGFTASGDRSVKLFLLDRHQDPQNRRPNPSRKAVSEAACQDNMYNTSPGTPGNAQVFDKGLWNMENAAGPVLNEVLATKKLPTGDSLEVLLAFVATQAVRLPYIKDTVVDVHDRVIKMQVDIWLSRPGGIEQFKAEQRNGGVEVQTDSLEELRQLAYIAKGVSARDQNMALNTMGTLARGSLPSLRRRKWAIVTAGESHFITSDRPAVPHHIDPADDVWPGPGHEVPGTVVAFPLSRKIAMMGTFDGSAKAGPLAPECVGFINRSTGIFASQIYSPTAEITWLKDDWSLGGTDDLKAEWAARDQYSD